MITDDVSHTMELSGGGGGGGVPQLVPSRVSTVNLLLCISVLLVFYDCVIK